MNQGFSSYLCLTILWFGSGSISLTNESGSRPRRPKNKRIWRIRVRIRIRISNTALYTVCKHYIENIRKTAWETYSTDPACNAQFKWWWLEDPKYYKPTAGIDSGLQLSSPYSSSLCNHPCKLPSQNKSWQPSPLLLLTWSRRWSGSIF
jgi:hypothetical protein